jgi:hypothetical protein
MVVGTKPAIRNDLTLARRVLAGGQLVRLSYP